jgi:hypothetical protein
MINNIKGVCFIANLHNQLTPNQSLGNNYLFVKWMQNGGLQFQINTTQQKSIPAEVLILAYHIHERNNRVSQPIVINNQWLCANGHTDWCFAEVINFLLNNYSI